MKPLTVKEMDKLRQGHEFYLCRKYDNLELIPTSKLTLRELLNFWLEEPKNLKFKAQDKTILKSSPYSASGFIPASYNDEIAFLKEIVEMELAELQGVIRKYSSKTSKEN